MSVDGRTTAFATLLDFDRRPRPVDELLARRLRGADAREAALAHALVQGILRWQGYLDGLIDHFASLPVHRLRPAVRVGLRFALFQMRFLDRIPAYAAINETVELLKRHNLPNRLVGFVNGVLRTMARADLDRLPLAVHQRASLPRWLFDRWDQRYGRVVTERLCAAVNEPAPLCLTILAGDRQEYLTRLQAAGIAAVPSPFAPTSVILQNFRGSPVSLPGYDEGIFQVQDQGAVLIAHLLEPAPPGPVLDGCAGVGGKTIALATLLPPDRPLLVCEPDHGRNRLLAENLARTRLSGRVTVHAESLADFGRRYTGPPLAAVLIDAPCAGLGILRRHPEIRWLRRPKDLRRYQRLQAGLLDQAAPLLAPDGVLVYATCSTEPEENDQVVQRFLDRHPEFTLEDCRIALPASAHPLVDEHGFFRTLPDRPRAPDGFFAARFRLRVSR